MNKKDLVDKVTEVTQYKKYQVEIIFDVATELIKSHVIAGHDVKLKGFGTFTKVKRKARTGRNPQTGKKIMIKAAYAPKFRAAEFFKEMVNG